MTQPRAETWADIEMNMMEAAEEPEEPERGHASMAAREAMDADDQKSEANGATGSSDVAGTLTGLTETMMRIVLEEAGQESDAKSLDRWIERLIRRPNCSGSIGARGRAPTGGEITGDNKPYGISHLRPSVRMPGQMAPNAAHRQWRGAKIGRF